MMKLVSSQSKWLAGLIILSVIALGFGGCSTNQLPVISSLTATNGAEINPEGSYQIECIASDPNGDELSYTWSADGGNITGEGSTVTWTAPDAPGAYTITVEVSDGRDGIATEQLNIKVSPLNSPPIIEDLTTDCPRVKPAGTATIECAAYDPDGDKLSYSWSAERGNISGEGSTATWVAPNATGYYIITVTVTDDRGGEATSSWITNSHRDGKIIVCTCGSACP